MHYKKTNVAENVAENVTEKEYNLICLIKENKFITTQQIVESLGVARMTVSRALNKLKNKQILKRAGGDKGGYWEIINK